MQGERILLARKEPFSSRKSGLFHDIIIFCIALFIFIWGYSLYEYWHLQDAVAIKVKLESVVENQQDKISLQQQRINNQQKHLEDFAEQVNSLKLKLIVLNRMEQEIRKVSEFVKKESPQSLEGIGGSIPLDLDGSIDLTKDHHRIIREIYDQIGQLDTSLADQEEGLKALLNALNRQRDLLNATPSISPVTGRVTSTYGMRASPFTGEREFHEGLDIATGHGAPIRAAAHGKVVFAAYDGSFGNVMIVDHGYGTRTRYAHISKFKKKLGDPVKKGEIIALVGNTGRSTGPHVHYEVSVNGKRVNPKKYIVH